MPTRLTEARSNAPSSPQPAGRREPSSHRARDAFFASFSRELRWSLDHQGRLTLVDGAWQSVLGWPPQDLQGWYWEELVHPADHRRVDDGLRWLRAGHACARDIEIRLARRAGGYNLTSWTFAPGSGADSILGVGQDTPAPPRASPLEVEQRNAELAARMRELEEQYAAVERFAATAAHQLAEPLVIAESSAILVAEELGEDLDPLLRARLDAIGRSAARARRLTDALLADARTSGLPLELHPVDLGSLVETTLASLSQQIEERSADVVVGALPRALGEAGLLSVVLENLISNALKYGPRSGGRVEISATRRPESWRVSVASEGIPIPPAEARRIFQAFYRAPGERRVPGVGLGLTICAQLIQRVGGAIGVDPGSADGGNVFWIDLRAA
jgi:signal transduction histidine kinase